MALHTTVLVSQSQILAWELQWYLHSFVIESVLLLRDERSLTCTWNFPRLMQHHKKKQLPKAIASGWFIVKYIFCFFYHFSWTYFDLTKIIVALWEDRHMLVIPRHDWSSKWDGILPDVRSEADETLFCNRERMYLCALRAEAEEKVEHWTSSVISL